MTRSGPLTGWPRWAAVLLLLLFLAQVAQAARYTSITLDEPLHITSGYASLVTGDYRLVEEHPPLLKMLQAAPLLLARPRLPDPRTVPGWAEGNLIQASQHVVVAYRPLEPLVFAARVPTMLVGVLLAALVYRWATDLFGAWAGLLALTLYSFDPNILAHAGVAATDLGAAAALFGAMYLFWRWLRQRRGPGWRRALVAGAVLGLALGVKSTALLLLPVFGLSILGLRPPGRRLAPYLGQALMAAGVAFVVLWAIYRFEVGPVPGGSLIIPAPSHLLPLQKLQTHMRDGHSAFLMGQNYHHGVWYYFPIAFLLKTPPLTLALLGLTGLALLVTRWSRLSHWRLPTSGWRDEALLSFLPLFYFGVSLFSTLNIGYRHLLPILPFVFVWVSRIMPAVAPARPLWRWGTGFALAAYAAVTLTLFPWHLAYFNVLAGGPDGGYRYLTDSNLDWGQTWKALQRYVEAQHITEFGLSQYTINDPGAYGLAYTPLPPWPEAPPVLPRRFNPAPGVYAISATTLQGVVVADPEMFDYFRNLEPQARVGHAMFVYEVAPSPPADWVAQCTNPVAPLPRDVLLEGLGTQDLRIAYFDCAQSWLYPPGNGWYVLPGGSGQAGEMRETHTRRARLAYAQKRPSAMPPFQVYAWFGRRPLEGLSTTQLHAAPSSWLPGQVEKEGVPLASPVRVGDELAFLGYVVHNSEAPANRITVETYWRVLQVPEEPVSLMAHLLDSSGVPIAVGDGLGVPLDQWRPGDVIAQLHTFDIPPGTPPGSAWLQFGAYKLADLTRFPVWQGQSVVGDRLVAGQIDVRAP